jgi:hypothetical protein
MLLLLLNQVPLQLVHPVHHLNLIKLHVLFLTLAPVTAPAIIRKPLLAHLPPVPSLQLLHALLEVPLMLACAPHLLLLGLNLVYKVHVLVLRPPDLFQERSDLVRKFLFEVQVHQLLRLVVLELPEHLDLLLQLF